jgi:hypothetical protein
MSENEDNENEKKELYKQALEEVIDRNIVLASISSVAAASVMGYVIINTVDQIVNAKIIESWSISLRSIRTAINELIWGNNDIDLTGNELVEYIRRVHVKALAQEDATEAIKKWNTISSLIDKTRSEKLLWVDIISSWAIRSSFEIGGVELDPAKKKAKK